MGGGHDASLGFFAVSMVMLMVAVPLLSMPMDADVGPITATAGEGTEESPFSGTITNSSGLGDGYGSYEIWALIGSEVNLDFIFAIDIGENPQVTMGFGLSLDSVLWSTYALTGVLTDCGNVFVTCGTRTYLTIHVVSDATELTFESSPSDGNVQWIGS